MLLIKLAGSIKNKEFQCLLSTGILYLIMSLVYPFVYNPIAKIELYF